MAEGQRHSRITISFIAAAAVVVFVAPIIIANDHFSMVTRWWFGILGGVAALVGALLSTIEVRSFSKNQKALIQSLADARQEVADARIEVQQVLQNHLFPITTTLDRIITASDEDELNKYQQQLKQTIVTVATGVIGPEGTRSCFLEYFPADNGKKRRLEWSVSSGRNGSPRRRFEAGTRDGDNLLDHLDRRAVEFCDDVRIHPPLGWDASLNRPYKMFVNVPVSVYDEHSLPFGMLTLDALKPGDLKKDDIPFLEFLARLLAIGMSVGKQ